MKADELIWVGNNLVVKTKEKDYEFELATQPSTTILTDMKYKIVIGRPAVNHTERVSVGNFLIEVAHVTEVDPEIKDLIEDVIHIPLAQVPATVARNRLVKLARQNRADLLFTIDDDMGFTSGWFKMALKCLIDNPPCVVAAPYVGGGMPHNVQVFEFVSPHNINNEHFMVDNITREDATRRKGIEKVANIGTGLIGYNMEVFNIFENKYKEKVFYEYSYNEDHTAVVETDDCYCHRKLWFAGVPIYCTWDYWAKHYKVVELAKPHLVGQDKIDKLYLEQARAEVKLGEKG